MKLNILCLYYEILNFYGDTGNIKVLEYHLKELKIKYNIDYLSLDDKPIFKNYDLVLIGAGTEKNRELALSHLIKYKNDIKKEIENNKFFLITGNALGMFGKTLNNKEALNIFNYETVTEKERISKEIILKNKFGKDIYGFLNHEDKTNNKENFLFENEGIKYKNFYGTYVLGPILSRNPDFLKYFLKKLTNNDKIKINTKLNDKAYKEFIEFKKTKVFNSHKA